MNHRQVPITVIKPLLEFMLSALDYLHTECHVIHTGMLIARLKIELFI